MTFSEACGYLGADYIRSDGSLYNTGAYIDWSPKHPHLEVVLDGEYETDELIAIATYVNELRSAVDENRRTQP